MRGSIGVHDLGGFAEGICQQDLVYLSLEIVF